MRPEGNLQHLTGGITVKARYQRGNVQERKGKNSSHWCFRYRVDVARPDGGVETIMRRQMLGPSKGENRISKKQAELARDKFLSSLNRPTAATASTPLILFGKLAELYLKNHVEVDSKISESTRQKYKNHISNHILPRWRDVRLADFQPLEAEEWLRSLDRSWWMMVDIRNIMSGIFTQAQAWGYWPEDRRNPMTKVNLGRKYETRPKRILTEQETNRVLALLQEPNRLIAEIALSNGARISEILGLQWKHVDLESGVIKVEQRYWRGDLDRPKTQGSSRKLVVGHLVARLRAKAQADGAEPEAFVFVRNDGSGKPLWDSGVRMAVKKATAAEGRDFPGPGMHSFRRANIT
jgi:integrase